MHIRNSHIQHGECLSTRYEARLCTVSLAHDANSRIINFPVHVQAIKTIGPIDVLINCAGISIAKTFDDTSIEEFQVLVLHLYFTSKTFYFPLSTQHDIVLAHSKYLADTHIVVM